MNSKSNLSRKAIGKLIPLELDDDHRRDEFLDKEEVPEDIINKVAGAGHSKISTRLKRKAATAAGNLVQSLIRDD